ncbi:MAG: zinc-binding dehydrogenase [Candidatus Binatia bacterium]
MLEVGELNPLMSRNATIRFLLVYDMPDAAKASACVDITRWLESGAAKHAVARAFPLAAVAAAHEEVEAGKKIGQVVVETGAG